jgi:hypothetical protein
MPTAEANMGCLARGYHMNDNELYGKPLKGLPEKRWASWNQLGPDHYNDPAEWRLSVTA